MDFSKLTAYEVIEQKTLNDLKSEGALLEHKKSGARILLISNDDDNKVFDIAFRTPTTEFRILWSILCCVALRNFRLRILLWS